LRRGAAEFESLLTEMLEQPPPKTALPERAMAIGYIVNESVRLMRNDVADKLFALVAGEGGDSLGGRSQGCLATAQAVRAFGAGQLSEALRHGQRALDILRRSGALRDVAETLGLCGYLQHELGVYEAATATFLEQHALGQRIGSPRDVAYSQLYLGVVAARQGQLDEAERRLLTAADGYRRLGSNPQHVESLTHLVAIACVRGNFARASEMIARAREVGLVDCAPTAHLSARASMVALQTGNASEALVQARNAYELAREQGVTEFLGIIAVSYVEALLANGERDSAREVLSTTRAWLDEQAAKIDDPAERQSYLTRVREHARVRELLASV
jgi:tetratricopeptide (TPR) repeat protein